MWYASITKYKLKTFVRPVLFGNRENDLSFVTDAISYVMTENQGDSMSQCPLQAARIYHNRAAFHCGQRKTAVQQKACLFSNTKAVYVKQTGLESTAEKMPEKVQYDIRLSDSYMTVEEQHKNALTEPDLEAVVHVYDFRMTLEKKC